jgi:iron complex outermembrane recepter protein
MIKYFLLLTITIVSTINIFAQNATTIAITTTYPNKDTVNATITLTDVNDSTKVLKSVAVNNKATFTVPHFSKYNIVVTAVGYTTKSYIANITTKPFNINFKMAQQATTLKGVVVTSKKPIIKQEDDKTIVDATVLANSSTNAYEVLEKTPGIVVDQDGNAYLSSATPATIFINGREMRMSAEDLAALLKNLPANSVSKIEILRTASAKYDAASSGGILNIVLKKGAKLGSSGSINVGYFQGVYATQFAGFNLNKGNGNTNYFGSYQFTNSKSFNEISSQRFITTTNPSAVNQNALTVTPSNNHYLSFGIDKSITKNFNLAYDVRTNISNNKSNAQNDIFVKSLPSTTLITQTNNAVNNNSNNNFLSNNLNAKYKIDSAGSEWVTDISLNFSSNKNNQNYKNTNFTPANAPTSGDGLTNNKRAVLLLQTDLTLKLPKKFTFEAGIKTSISNAKNAANFFIDSAATGRRADNFQTNTFKYKETIAAAYLQVAKTVGGFTFKPGLRLEYTNIQGNQIIPTDTTFKIKRTDVFPFLFIRTKSFKVLGFSMAGNLIAKRSIRRPYYDILNPYPRFVDQFLFNVGNPNVKPQFTNTYEANIMVEDFPVFALGVNETQDIFSNVTYQDDATKIVYRTYDNLGKNKETYFRAVGGIPPNGKYFFYVGAQHSFNNYNGTYAGRPLQYKRGSWVFFTYHEYKPTNTLSFTLNGFWRTNGLQDFYELQNFGGIYFTTNKTILKKKANIILTINDIFRSNKQQFSIVQANVNSQGMRIFDTRRVGLTFRYNFGLSKPKNDIEFGGNIENKVSQ